MLQKPPDVIESLKVRRPVLFLADFIRYLSKSEFAILKRFKFFFGDVLRLFVVYNTRLVLGRFLCKRFRELAFVLLFNVFLHPLGLLVGKRLAQLEIRLALLLWFFLFWWTFEPVLTGFHNQLVVFKFVAADYRFLRQRFVLLLIRHRCLLGDVGFVLIAAHFTDPFVFLLIPHATVLISHY